MTKLIAPNGLEIRGTLERLTGVALASITRDKNGAVCIEHLGETEIEWDGQTTEFRDGKAVLVDEEGNEWTSDQLVEEPDGDESPDGRCPDPDSGALAYVVKEYHPIVEMLHDVTEALANCLVRRGRMTDGDLRGRRITVERARAMLRDVRVEPAEEG